MINDKINNKVNRINIIKDELRLSNQELSGEKVKNIELQNNINALKRENSEMKNKLGKLNVKKVDKEVEFNINY
jgi:hypothetical protein